MVYGFRIELPILLRSFDIAVALFPHLLDESPKIGNHKRTSYLAVTIENFFNGLQWSVRNPIVRSRSFEYEVAVFPRTSDFEEFAISSVMVSEEKHPAFVVLKKKCSTRQGFWPIPFAFISGVDNVWILNEGCFHFFLPP